MKWAKTWVKRILAQKGYQIIRVPERLKVDARFGLEVLGYLVDDLASRSSANKLSLLQVGANDGKDEDPVFEILRRLPIPSILCEPLPDLFARLEQTYASFDYVKPVQCAIASTDGELTLYRIAASAGPQIHSKVTSFNRGHVQHFVNKHELPPESLVEEKVPSLTVGSLLNARGWNSVDIVAIDTEGMDHLVCAQALKLDPLPQIIHFEYCNSPIMKVQEIMKTLTEHGYRFVRSGIDITAMRV